MAKTIRIGTRDSELALWQAHTVQDQLNALGYNTELVSVKSTGDLILDKPLYELGITGIFTKTLDVAMINGDVDIAVHSMKDGEIDNQRRKIANFNEEQAEIITERIIQKITTQFAKHLKTEDLSNTESLDLIQKVFNLQNH